MQTLEKPNILVVDDFEDNILYIEKILRPLPVQIIRATSGKEALKMIRGIHLALALIDINMPEMDGAELASIINLDRKGNIIPIIFITAYQCDDESLTKFYQSGIIDFIQKPFQSTILKSKVQVFLELDLQKQKLLESEEMYRMLLNASPEGIIIINPDGLIREISEIATGIFGINNKHDFIGQEFLCLFPFNEQNRMQEVIYEACLNEMPINVVFQLNKADQTQFICEMSLTMIMGKDSKPGALMVIVRDITQRKTMEQQLIHTERMAGLGEMATGIAHEINQPLNILSLSFENILFDLKHKEKLDELILEDRSRKIFDSIYRIEKIIDHIRFFSRDQQDYILTLFDVNLSIMNAQSMISQQFINKNIEIVNILDENIPSIVGNTYKFEQVILNLMLNAKDALEEKQHTLTNDYRKIIEIKTTCEHEHIFVDVCDNGIGIKPEDLQKIMLPFFSTKEAKKGTGLGLSITFGIVKELNGDIEASSNPGFLTRFRIKLPIELIKRR